MQPFRKISDAFNRHLRQPWFERKQRRHFEKDAWNGHELWHYRALAENFPTAVNWKDTRGATLLHFAAKWKGAEFCGWLAEKGADVNAADKFGRTPLHRAAAGDGIDATAALEALLKHGAALEARNEDGETPLLQAFNAGRTQNIAALVLAGADAAATDKTGASPFSKMEKNPAHPSSLALRRAVDEVAAHAENAARHEDKTRKRDAAEDAVAAVRQGLACEVPLAKPLRFNKK